MKSTLATEHQQQGRMVQVGPHQAFVIEKGEGVPVVCFHGVPATSFLYRKIIDGLSEHNLKGISFDLIGMGLSDRPEAFDYSWTGLGQWAYELLQQMDLGSFHIVLHDIGGPVACEIMSRMPDQILSVTLLNTPLTNLPAFHKPFPMFFFPMKGIGELFLGTTTPFLFQQLMHMRGIHQHQVFGLAEARAYVRLLKGNDKGRAFLKIMRSFEPTAAKEALYIQTLKALHVPKQIIWGVHDKGLSLKRYAIPLQQTLGLSAIIETPGSHFLQEDYAREVVERIATLIASPTDH